MKKRSPIIINVPHSSTFIPEEDRKFFVTEKLDHELLVMTDHYCDDLFDAGYEMIRFPVSRLVCDFERFRNDEDEVMSTKGMGACYTSCSDLTPLRYISNDHREELLKQYYDPYHKVLELAVAERLGQYGHAIIVDGHSFPYKPLPYELNQDNDRPDICIGTDEFHTPGELTERMCNAFEGMGYRVAVNTPFAGALVPVKYYQRDKRVVSIMIEINRRLYMNGHGEITAGYEMLRENIRSIFIVLAGFFVCDAPMTVDDL